MKKWWKIVLGVVLGLVLLCVLAVGFTQTKIFREWLRGYILSTVHRNTNGQLYLGDFSGSLFTGLTINGVSLSLGGEELFTADLVELRYNPLELPQKHIALGKLVLTHPRIHLSRSRDGSWNFERLPREKRAPTQTSPNFLWAIELKSLEIVNGEFSLVDSTVTETLDSLGLAMNP
ncbi:MAG: AsmA family protein, partial [Bacteroidota bacterium]